MDFVFLKDFLTSYSLPTTVIAVAVATVNIILSFFLKDKYPPDIKTFAPFILSIVAYCVYDAISMGVFMLREQAFYAGILSGSLSIAISSTVNKISTTKSLGINTSIFIIQSLIKNLVKSSNLTTTAISLENLIAQNNDDEQGLINAVKEVLKTNSDDTICDDELFKVAYLLVQTVLSLKR